MPEQDFVVISGRATATSQWIPELSNGRGISLQVGKAGNFYAYTLLKWDPVLVLPDSHRVESVQVKLTTARIWPDVQDSVVFVPDLRMIVYEITDDWIEEELTPGSFEDFEQYPILDTILVPATEDDSLTFELPLELWQKWVDEALGDTSSSDTVTSRTSFGLLLAPENEDVLVEFVTTNASGIPGDSLRTSPLLQMTGHKFVEDEDNPGEYLDSALYLEQLPQEDGYVVRELAEPQDGRMYITQGFPERALTYFPLDTLVTFADRLIAHAEFRVYGDFENSENVDYNTGIFYKTGSTLNADWVDSPDSLETVQLRFVGTTAETYEGTHDYIAFDVTGIIAGWLSGGTTIGGLQLQSSSENQFLTREVFYSATAEDSTKRPELVLWYVEPSN